MFDADRKPLERSGIMMTISNKLTRRTFGAMMLSSGAAACTRRVPKSNPEAEAVPQFAAGYEPISDAGFNLPGIPTEYTLGINRRMEGFYTGEAAPGTIDVDPYAKFLYLVQEDGRAIRYPVGVGRAGRSFSGSGTIKLKKKWPGWTPTQNMIRTEPEVYGPFRRGIPGGLRSPLGARALYLYRGNRDTFYRIHGTNDLESIGNSGSAGCIRMFNQDIIDLFERVDTPMQVNVRSEDESLRVDPEYFGRGLELPPKFLDADEVYAAIETDPKPNFDDPIEPVDIFDVPEVVESSI